MQRCALPAVLGLALALALPLSAAAQAWRPFPATALRGTLQVTQPPEVLLNGKSARLSPGSRIRGQDNLLQMSGALVGQKLVVHYTTEINGLVHEVWILTAEEQARKPWPTTAAEAASWSYDPAAGTWTKR